MTPTYLTITEYGLFYTIEDSISIDEAQFLFEGPYGIFTAQNVGLFVTAIEAHNFTLIEENWGLTEVQTPFFLAYFTDATYRVATPYIHSLFEEGGGLFTNRTVVQWLFNATDPLLLWLQPEKPTCSLLVNLTSEDDTRARTEKSILYTGKDDIQQIDYCIFGAKGWRFYRKLQC
jgi:hypothetical protein